MLPFLRRESGYCAIEWSTPSPYADQKGYFSLTDAEVAATVTALAATNVKVDLEHVKKHAFLTDAFAKGREVGRPSATLKNASFFLPKIKQNSKNVL